MEPVNDAHLLVGVMGFEEYGTESGRQGESVDGGDDDRHSHRNTKLTIEGARRATHEAHRHKHSRHHKGDGDDSTGYLAHCVGGSEVGRLVTLVELGMHGLHHDDGVVHHDGDCQHQCRQRKQVNTEAKQIEEEECTYQRHGHSHHRDNSGAQVLQEDVHYQYHQQEGDEQSLNHLADGGIEKLRHVLTIDNLHARGE